MTEPIFISHARSDRKVADMVCKALEDRGVPCWIATRDVAPGENFGDAISRVIRASRVMVLVFSDSANNSEEIKKEVVLASRSRVAVIPLRVEDVEPRGAFEYELLTRQWIDLFAGWDQAMARLTRQIEQIAAGGSVDAIAPLAVPVMATAVRRAPRRWLVPAVLAAMVAVAAGAFGVAQLGGGRTGPEPVGAMQPFQPGLASQTQPDAQAVAAAQASAEAQRQQAEQAQRQQQTEAANAMRQRLLAEQERAQQQQQQQQRADQAAVRQTEQDAAAATVQAMTGVWSFAGERSCRTHSGTVSVDGDRITFVWRDNGRTNTAVERVVSVVGNAVSTIVIRDDATVNNELGQRMRYVVSPTSWTSLNERSVSGMHQRC